VLQELRKASEGQFLKPFLLDRTLGHLKINNGLFAFFSLTVTNGKEFFSYFGQAI